MGRFESPFQVAGLFLAASVVSVGFIFFINAEAHSRLTALHSSLSHRDNNNGNEPLPDPARIISEDSSLSSSSTTSSELTSYTSSNYNNSSATSSYSSSSIIEGTNVTLLNFLEDGLTKLLSLIKQAKNTYQSYYRSHHHGYEYNMEGKEEEEEGERGGSANNRKYSRKKRQVTIARRNKRAVISPSKQRRIGENEPYYWQMLEDNEHQDKQVRRHNLKELPTSSMSTGHYTYSHSQQSHYPHHHNQQQQQQQHQLGESNSHYPVVASASTGKIDVHSQQHSISGSSSSSNPTSDFHKIRHAMNKLGGLDLSVVERMILDTKSNSRSTQKQQQHQQQEKHYRNNQQQQQQHYNAPSSNRIHSDGFVNTRGHHHNKGHYQQNENSIPSSESLLTTSTTKTTHQARQDELFFANQLRHQQQQLAQSLLPPTVTWFDSEGDSSSEGDETTLHFLPLPSSSLSTGSLNTMDVVDDDDDDKESDDNEIDRKSMYPREREQRKRIMKERKSKARSKHEHEDNEGESHHLAITNSSVSDNESFEDDSKRIINGESYDEEEDEEDLESPVVLMGNHHSGKDCYKTDDVLIVVAITCIICFSSFSLVWLLVRWFSMSGNPKEKDFQNLGDCDDTLDPTIVFHGVTEDPCWTLASTGRKCDRGGGSSGGGGLARNCGGNGVGGIAPTHSAKTQHLYSERSAHDDDDDDDDMYPMVGSCGRGPGTTIQTSVMNDKRLAGDGSFIMNGSTINSVYSFRPEHVPPHIIHRSYSQSMEDLRYLE